MKRPTPRRSSDGEWLHDKAPNTSVPKKSLPGKANTPGTVNNAKLVVSNLHYEVTARDLTVCNMFAIGSFVLTSL